MVCMVWYLSMHQSIMNGWHEVHAMQVARECFLLRSRISRSATADARGCHPRSEQSHWTDFVSVCATECKWIAIACTWWFFSFDWGTYQQRPDRITRSGIVRYSVPSADSVACCRRVLEVIEAFPYPRRPLSTIHRDTLFISFHRWLISRYVGSDETLSSCHDLSWFIVALHVGAVVVHID